jgi:hypothetical protein
MVVKFRNTIWPPPPQLSLHRRAALSSNSNGTRFVYSRENPKHSLYCEMSVCRTATWDGIARPYAVLIKPLPLYCKLTEPPVKRPSYDHFWQKYHVKNWRISLCFNCPCTTTPEGHYDIWRESNTCTIAHLTLRQSVMQLCVWPQPCGTI